MNSPSKMPTDRSLYGERCLSREILQVDEVEGQRACNPKYDNRGLRS